MMKRHLKFSSGDQKKFLKKVIVKSGLEPDELASRVGVSARTLRDWKREKFCISEGAFNKFCKWYNIRISNKNELIKDWGLLKLTISRKGGLKRYEKYGNFSTPEGRRKGGSKTLKILRIRGVIAPNKNFSFPKHKDSDLAEFVGIMLGDGSLTKFQASITLNSEADKDYIKYVYSLILKLFDDKPTLIKKKDCRAIDLRLSGIKLVKYLIRIGLKVGNKVKQQVDVPIWVKSSQDFSIACLRGLMDTDGCIVKSVHTYKTKKFTYFNPCFANRSKPLLNFVSYTLNDLGLHPSIAGERIWLYNKAEVQKYFELVGSNNFRLTKFKESIPIGSGSGSLNRVA